MRARRGFGSAGLLVAALSVSVLAGAGGFEVSQASGDAVDTWSGPAAELQLQQVADEAQVLALFRGGYTMVPGDVEQAAADVVPGDEGKAAVWDPVLQRASKTVGPACRALTVVAGRPVIGDC